MRVGVNASVGVDVCWSVVPSVALSLNLSCCL